MQGEIYTAKDEVQQDNSAHTKGASHALVVSHGVVKEAALDEVAIANLR